MSLVEHIISLMAIPITITINYTGYVGIAFLMAVESACIPPPMVKYITVGNYHDLCWRDGIRGAI